MTLTEIDVKVLAQLPIASEMTIDAAVDLIATDYHRPRYRIERLIKLKRLRLSATSYPDGTAATAKQYYTVVS